MGKNEWVAVWVLSCCWESAHCNSWSVCQGCKHKTALLTWPWVEVNWAGCDKVPEKLPDMTNSSLRSSQVLKTVPQSRDARVVKDRNRKGLSLTDPFREHWVLLGLCLPKASTARMPVPVMLCSTVTHVVTAKILNWVWILWCWDWRRKKMHKGRFFIWGWISVKKGSGTRKIITIYVNHVISAVLRYLIDSPMFDDTGCDGLNP